MLYLAVVSLVWAFSFGLIKGVLAGVDPNFVSGVRMALACLVFLPFFRSRGVGARLVAEFLVLGAVQFGLMYIFYIASFTNLKAYEVALFTIFTPFFVTLFQDCYDRTFNWRSLVAVAIAVVGTAVVVYQHVATEGFLLGFLLVQASNVCFALGQIHYRVVMARNPQLKDAQVFALLYAGAVGITAVAAAWTGGYEAIGHLSGKQVLTLAYLGVLASGVCFFLWNLGARQISTGALAIFNNAKMPLAVACSLLIFGEKGNPVRLCLGIAIMAVALGLNELFARSRPAPAPVP